MKKIGLWASLWVVGMHMAYAAPDSALINAYNEAAMGNEDRVEEVYHQLNGLIEQQGATPLTLVYLGSTQMLQGRDAFLPWNKMKYVEQGVASIEKGLGLIDAMAQDKAQAMPDIVQGLPENMLARAVAAISLSQLPDLFNQLDHGYDLYLGLLAEPAFRSANFEATAWIYGGAIEAALRSGDWVQAEAWLAEMGERHEDHPQTLKARTLVFSDRGL
ncbi:hypothetical protein ABT56_00710 [Photobacterium aquae]|uniref:Uncharacterized protein n=1 Tax=Photobacterium aquae TaxID=1195763 RepID=A0A0J1HDC1_9GAMM|nr:hypothetical protein [Photobacterium aquae]KLV09633.1 hypothetical protein ABT56_00710 [Photobacterium aquae]